MALVSISIALSQTPAYTVRQTSMDAGLVHRATCQHASYKWHSLHLPSVVARLSWHTEMVYHLYVVTCPSTNWVWHTLTLLTEKMLPVPLSQTITIQQYVIHELKYGCHMIIEYRIVDWLLHKKHYTFKAFWRAVCFASFWPITTNRISSSKTDKTWHWDRTKIAPKTYT